MATEDIYQVQGNFENPSGASSFTLFYEESAVRSGVGTDNSVLARSWDDAISPAIRDVIADDWLFSSVVVRKMVANPVPKFRLDLATQIGTRTGPSLPANNALLIQLQQGLFPSSSNGRIFIPGVAEGDTDVGNLTAAFTTAAVQPLVDALAAELVEDSGGTGRWKLGVISAKVLNAALPFKDWAGAFSEVFGVGGSPIIATQRRRQTRVIGAAL